MDGGFAEYAAYSTGKVFKIHNLSDVNATLLEPYVLSYFCRLCPHEGRVTLNEGEMKTDTCSASCAAHGLDRIRPRLGSSVLMLYVTRKTSLPSYTLTVIPIAELGPQEYLC